MTTTKPTADGIATRTGEMMMSRKTKTTDQPLQVLLANRGNPDFDQDPTRPLWRRPADRWVAVTGWADASRICIDYIREHELGGGNWIGGEVRNAATRRVVAHVSYNGRVWEGGRDSDVEISLGRPGETRYEG